MIDLVIQLVILGVIGYLILLIPMIEPIRKAVIVVFTLVAVLMVLGFFGIDPGIHFRLVK